MNIFNPIIMAVGLVTLASCASPGGSSSSNKHSIDSYQEKVMSVEEIERSDPRNFLAADGTYRENFWGDKLKINCTITNKATLATYKDAVVRVTYYSKTKTELGSKDYTIYEMLPPHSSKTVEMNIENYKDVSSIGLDIVNAVAN